MITIQQYQTIKTQLNQTDFTNMQTLQQLYKLVSPDLSFRLFCKVVKLMGVYSYSKRAGDRVYRVYKYNSVNDRLLLRLMPVLAPCEACGGKGVIRVSNTLYKKTIDNV